MNVCNKVYKWMLNKTIQKLKYVMFYINIVMGILLINPNVD